ncbi:MAG: FAD-binding oxidoreductase, partial [Acidobacteriota bacterium]|nr:FAD-binding oxidoreductase [Acidobacteriota bacterium]
MGRHLVRGAGVVGRPRRVAVPARARAARGGGGGVRVHAQGRAEHRRLRRRPPARCDPLPRRHRRARRGERLPGRRLRPLRARSVGACVRGGRPAATPRVLPRPRARRGDALRRPARPRRRRPPAGPLGCGERARAEAAGGRPVGVVSRVVPRRGRVEEVDRRALAAALRTEVEGEVRFDTGARALYATDASNYRQVPIGVVVPRTLDDVVAVHRLCHAHGAPIVNRGGGTSLAGQGCNVAVVVDFSKYLRQIVDIDPVRRRARVHPGVVLDQLRKETETRHQLTFAPDPSTHPYCTLGGMLGNNSCGRHSVMSEFRGPGPRVSDHVVELEVITYRGDRLRIGRGGTGVPEEIAAELRALVDRYADRIRERYPQIPRRVSGYNLDDLLPEKGFEVA